MVSPLATFSSFPPDLSILQASVTPAPVPSGVYTTEDKTEFLVRDFILSLYWDPTKNDYRNVPFNEAEFLNLLDENNQRFKLQHNPASDYGTIAKKDLEPKTKIYVRADLHGDLKSLVENLIAIQKEGLLDHNFRCKPGVQLVLLGDYMDRGKYILQLVKLLILLRFENESQVLLIKGNHEDISMNQNPHFNQKNPEFVEFLKSEIHQQKLTEFYHTLYLAVYLSQKNDQGRNRHYSCFPHALFELSIDTAEMIDSPKEFNSMAVPKSAVISQRIRALAKFDEDANPLSLESWNKIEELKKALAGTKPKTAERKELKLTLAAAVILRLEKSYRSSRHPDVTVYNWAVMQNPNYKESRMGYPGMKEWRITEEDVKHALHLQSIFNYVKMVWRGHDHYPKIYSIKNKALLYTLPIGANSDTKLYYVDDHFLILETGAHIDDWTRQKFIRKVNESTMVKCEKVKARDPEMERAGF